MPRYPDQITQGTNGPGPVRTPFHHWDEGAALVEGPDLVFCLWGRSLRLHKDQHGSHYGPAARCRGCGVLTFEVRESQNSAKPRKAIHEAGCTAPPAKFPKNLNAKQRQDYLGDVTTKLRQLEEVELDPETEEELTAEQEDADEW